MGVDNSSSTPLYSWPRSRFRILERHCLEIARRGVVNEINRRQSVIGGLFLALRTDPVNTPLSPRGGILWGRPTKPPPREILRYKRVLIGTSKPFGASCWMKSFATRHSRAAAGQPPDQASRPISPRRQALPPREKLRHHRLIPAAVDCARFSQKVMPHFHGAEHPLGEEPGVDRPSIGAPLPSGESGASARH